MVEKVIRLTPDDLGYKDRGKMKWLGLMLSDHLDVLKTMDKEDENREPKPKRLMSEKEISQYLQKSYTNKVPIIIQANVLKNGNYYPDIYCLVLGFQDDKIFLLLKDNRRISCEINQIRNIEFMDPIEWYNKNKI